MNNSTIFTADRTTHLKIVVVALVASIAVLIVGITAHMSSDGAGQIQTAGPAFKATKSVTVTKSDSSAIR